VQSAQACRTTEVVLAIQEGLADGHLGGILHETDLVGHRLVRMIVQQRVEVPHGRFVSVVHEHFAKDGVKHGQAAIRLPDLPEHLVVSARCEVFHALAVVRNVGAPVDQPAHRTFGQPVRRAGDDHASPGMAEQHGVGDPIVAKIGDERVDCLVEAGLFRISGAGSGKRRRVNHVPLSTDVLGHTLEQVARMPGAMNQNVGAHDFLPLFNTFRNGLLPRPPWAFNRAALKRLAPVDSIFILMISRK